MPLVWPSWSLVQEVNLFYAIVFSVDWVDTCIFDGGTDCGHIFALYTAVMLMVSKASPSVVDDSLGNQLMMIV